MKHRIISLLLAAALAFGTASAALAVGSTVPPVFGAEETSAALAEAPGLDGTAADRILTQQEGRRLLTRAMGWTLNEKSPDFELDAVCLSTSADRDARVLTVVSTPSSRNQPMTVRDFFALHGVLGHPDMWPNQYWYIVDDALTSPLLGTAFLSEDEAAALTLALDQPLNVGDAAVLCSRLAYFYGLLDAPDAPEIFAALLPEYGQVLELVGTDALDYWMEGTWSPVTFRKALHEMVHEYVARLENQYRGRERYENSKRWWGKVHYRTGTLKTYLTGDGLVEASPLALPGLSILTARVPEAWKTEQIFTTYLADGTASTIYDAFQEYTATAAELTASFRLNALCAHPVLMDRYNARDWYTAWSYYIQLYFLTVKEERPEAWEALLADGSIARVFSETDARVGWLLSLDRSGSGLTDTTAQGDELREALSAPHFTALREELAAAAKEAVK